MASTIREQILENLSRGARVPGAAPEPAAAAPAPPEPAPRPVAPAVAPPPAAAPAGEDVTALLRVVIDEVDLRLARLVERVLTHPALRERPARARPPAREGREKRDPPSPLAPAGTEPLDVARAARYQAAEALTPVDPRRAIGATSKEPKTEEVDPARLAAATERYERLVRERALPVPGPKPEEARGRRTPAPLAAEAPRASVADPRSEPPPIAPAQPTAPAAAVASGASRGEAQGSSSGPVPTDPGVAALPWYYHAPGSSGGARDDARSAVSASAVAVPSGDPTLEPCETEALSLGTPALPLPTGDDTDEVFFVPSEELMASWGMSEGPGPGADPDGRDAISAAEERAPVADRAPTSPPAKEGPPPATGERILRAFDEVEARAPVVPVRPETVIEQVEAIVEEIAATCAGSPAESAGTREAGAGAAAALDEIRELLVPLQQLPELLERQGSPHRAILDQVQSLAREVREIARSPRPSAETPLSPRAEEERQRAASRRRVAIDDIQGMIESLS